MFKNKKKSLVEDVPNHSYLSEVITLTGELQAGGDILINSSIQGNVYCSGRIIVGKAGNIQGNIYSSIVEIMGKVTGDIVATELLVLRSACLFEGKIRAGKLEVEPGARFMGNCHTAHEEDNEEVIAKEMGKIPQGEIPNG